MIPLPVVTTLLPTNTLNAWVDAAVRSALAQDHSNHEVLVIHDGIVPDRSRAWTTDDRVTCVATKTSQGLGNALALGARSAQGDLLARLDGDDLAEPTRISRQLAHLKAHTSTVLVGALAHRIDENGTATGVLGDAGTGDIRSDLLIRNAVMHSSVLFWRTAYQDAGGYDARLRQMEDYHLWLRMALLGDIRVVQERLIRYRVHPGQMSRGAAPRGDHITSILHSRQQLARHLGVSESTQRARDLVWLVAQYARYYGLRKPGYV